jgi:hypothetical protein
MEVFLSYSHQDEALQEPRPETARSKPISDGTMPIVSRQEHLSGAENRVVATSGSVAFQHGRVVLLF